MRKQPMPKKEMPKKMGPGMHVMPGSKMPMADSAMRTMMTPPKKKGGTRKRG